MICLRCKKEFKPKRKDARYCSRNCKERSRDKRNRKHLNRKRKNKYSNVLAYRQIILSYFKNKCSNCGASDNLHLHHIIPRYMGGNNDIGNITPLCEKCHILTYKKELSL